MTGRRRWSRVKYCEACRAPIVWCRRWDGRKIPVDASPVDDGDLVSDDAGLIVSVTPGMALEPNVPRYQRHVCAAHPAPVVRRSP